SADRTISRDERPAGGRRTHTRRHDMAKREVFIVGAARTPIGAFQGALSEVPVTELGATAIRAALERSGLSGEDVGETYMGNVLTAGVGQAPARQAAKAAGVPDRVPATTVGKVCGS